MRIQKLIQRKGKFNSGYKTCKNCNREYDERENYNWSCKQHLSQFGGDIWWCCGKPGKEQPGCKLQKHESKEDDEDDNEEHEGDKQKSKKFLKCTCCKEVGHLAHDCTRDPNIKRTGKADAEFERI